MLRRPRRLRSQRQTRRRLILVPVAMLATAVPAAAEERMTLAVAQQKLFPGAKLTPADFKLSPEQYARLKREYNVPAFRPAVRAWRAEGAGWLYLDQVYGLNDIVTYLLAVGNDGKVQGLEVLVCADGYCDLYTPEWLGRLKGRVHGRWSPEEAVTMVSGATLSCTHVAEGVKKMLAIHARFKPQDFLT
jgi:hypothetical protein